MRATLLAALAVAVLAALVAGGLLLVPGGEGDPGILEAGIRQSGHGEPGGPDAEAAPDPGRGSGGPVEPISPSSFQGDGEQPPEGGDAGAAEDPADGPERHILLCTIVDLSGRPMGGAMVQVAMQAPSWRRDYSAATDADGRLRFPWRAPPWQPGTSRSIGFDLIEREIAVASARVDANREFPEGKSDLGTVVMVPLPRLVSGIVVGEDGEPRPGAQVQLLWRCVGDRRLESMEGWDFSGVPPCNARKDGTFDIRGNLEPGDLLLMVHQSPYLPDTVGPLDFGATGVVATLKRSFSYQGKVLLPEGAPPDQILVRLAKDPPAPATYSVAPDKHGVFRVPWMSRGTGRLDVSLARMSPADAPPPEPFNVSALFIKSLGTVAIVPPGKGEEELLTIDLRHLLKAIEIEVQPADPALEIQEASIAVTDARGGRGTFEAPLGKCVVVAANLPLALAVSSPGFQNKTVGGVDGDVRIALDQGLQLEARVFLPGPLPDGASELDVRAIVSGGDIPRVDGRARCDDHGVARLLVGAAGMVTLQASVLVSGASRSARVDLGPSVAANPGEGPGVFIVDMPIHAANLEDLRKQIATQSPHR